MTTHRQARRNTGYFVMIVLMACAAVWAGIRSGNITYHRSDISPADIGNHLGTFEYSISSPVGLQVAQKHGLDTNPARFQNGALVITYNTMGMLVSKENEELRPPNFWPAIGWGLLAAVCGWIAMAIALAIVIFLWWFLLLRVEDVGMAWRGTLGDRNKP